MKQNARPAPMTRRRFFIGVLGALIIAGAVLVLGPDARQAGGLLSGGELVERDLDVIMQDTLRVLVIQHHLTYTRVQGGETGLEYELLKRMARQLKVPIMAVVVERSDSLLPMLRRGAGDVIAAQLARNGAIAKRASVTTPYRFVSPVYTVLRTDRILGLKVDLDPLPDTAWVSAWSPFAPAQLRFPGDDGDVSASTRTIFTDTSRFGDNPVINVALGRVKAAILSDASAGYFARSFPQLAFSEVAGEPVPLVFAVRSNSRRLLRALDTRINDPKEKDAMSMLMMAYGFEVPERDALGSVPCTSEEGAELPRYAVEPFVGTLAGNDQELLAAIAFKNAALDTVAAPDTHQGDPLQRVNLPHNMANAQLRAAARYLAELDSIWAPTIPDPTQRLRFVLASYSVGAGHVMDARALAEVLHLDPQRWEGDVERVITLLALPRYFSLPVVKNGPCRGSDTFIRVREVSCLYDHFRAASRRP
jgi:membrane-bound lytic murein transglycosylase F